MVLTFTLLLAIILAPWKTLWLNYRRVDGAVSFCKFLNVRVFNVSVDTLTFQVLLWNDLCLTSPLTTVYILLIMNDCGMIPNTWF